MPRAHSISESRQPTGGPRSPALNWDRYAQVLAVVLLPLGVGCAGRSTVENDLYQRELRLQEDEIYRLEDCIEEYQDLVRKYRCENEALRTGAPVATSSGGAKSSSSAERTRSALDVEPAGTRDDRQEQRRSTPTDSNKTPVAPEIELPEIDPGEPIDPPAPSRKRGPGFPSGPKSGPLDEAPPFSELPRPGRVAPPAVTPPAVTPPAVTLPDGAGPESIEAPPFDSGTSSPPVQPMEEASLYAEPAATAEGGAPALMAFVEPLTEDGRAAAFRGGASLLLLDPSAPKASRDLARWDFTQDEIELAWRDGSRRVLDLPLALEGPAPDDRPLELWVRLIDASGRKGLARTTLHMPRVPKVVRVDAKGGSFDTGRPVVLDSSWAVASASAPKAQSNNKVQAGATREAPGDAPGEIASAWRTADPVPRTASGVRRDDAVRTASLNVAPKAPRWTPDRPGAAPQADGWRNE